MVDEAVMRPRLNGSSELPPGTIATIVTYLDMRKPPADRPAAREGWSLVPLSADAFLCAGAVVAVTLR